MNILWEVYSNDSIVIKNTVLEVRKNQSTYYFVLQNDISRKDIEERISKLFKEDWYKTHWAIKISDERFDDIKDIAYTII